MEIIQASHEWATRPNDQRFTSLSELKQSVEQRKKESWTAVTPAGKLQVFPTQDQDLIVSVFDPTQGEARQILPTNWAFGQLAQYAKAPAAYLRSLPAELAAINLQWGLEHQPIRDEALILARTNGESTLRSMTSTTYGRIWDIDVVRSVEKVNRDGRWKIPSASYATQNPKRATTLYASDRDVFIFLVDDTNPVEVNGEKLFRGFYTWNSEVGSATFGLTTFLYRYVCDNRIIWGATEVKELKIRHTGGAPERFAHEGALYLQKYAEETTYKTVETIKKASQFELPPSEKKQGSGWEDWLKSRGFTSTVAKQAIEKAKEEEGDARSLWDIVNGITAHARSIPYNDERTKLEAQAGKLLEVVA